MKTTAHPRFAKRLSDGDSAAGFIAAAKCGKTSKTVAEIDKANTGGKPRKCGRRSGNGKDGGNRPSAWRVKDSRNPQESRTIPSGIRLHPLKSRRKLLKSRPRILIPRSRILISPLETAGKRILQLTDNQ